MVNEITPTYYAAGQQLIYTLTGSGFDGLPNNVVGIRSIDNRYPLQYRGSDLDIYVYDLTEKSDTRIVFTSRFSDNFTLGGYLGGILSNDRNHVFWVNNSQPLPANRGDIVEQEFIDER